MMKASIIIGTVVLTVLIAQVAQAQDVRRFTRSTQQSQPLTETQAAAVTLTLTDAQVRPIQTWVRAAGAPDASGKTVRIVVRGAQAGLVQTGQRLRAFSVLSRAQMQQGRVVRVSRIGDQAVVEAELASPLFGSPARCLVEIVTEAGPFLSIPNVSIIEEGDRQVVYLQQKNGGYLQREIETGIQGELYTQIVGGLSENDEVVSVGSFFVDADIKLKSTGGMPAMPGMDHGAMAGMDHGAMDHGAAAEPAPTRGPTAKLTMMMTEPASSATVTAPIGMIHVMFNRTVDPLKSEMELIDASGRRMAAKGPTSMGRDGTFLMLMPETDLAPGAYRVKWRATGLDAAVIDGDFSFVVK